MFKLLINAEYIRTMASVDDDKRLETFIYHAQQTHIRFALGSDLLDKILEDYHNNTITGRYKELLETLVQPTHSIMALYEAAPFISIKITNQGVLFGDSANNPNAGIDGVEYLRKSLLKLGQFYLAEIGKYCCQWSNELPEYNQNNGLDKYQPMAKQYFSGMLLNTGRDASSMGSWYGCYKRK
jgi:hypothetical protein